MRNDRQIRRYTTSEGRVIYKLPVLAYPHHVTNCYLVRDEKLTLIDTGSGAKFSDESLVDCFKELGEKFGEKLSLSDVERVIITHGHVDHFGGLNFVIEQSGAEVAIHELDASVLTNFAERVVVTSKNLQIFLDRAGVSDAKVKNLIQMNKWSKNIFKATKVDIAFDEGELPASALRIYHTPGHCPGQVCLQLDDVLFTADHVLSHITPNQSPEFITRYTGLGHYMASLRGVRRLEGVRLGLGGHENEIEDVGARIDETLAFHERRLEKTLDQCREPRTIKQISEKLFPRVSGYHVLLALNEAGAHVEYLYERGRLVVANIDEVEREPNPDLLYQAN